LAARGAPPELIAETFAAALAELDVAAPNLPARVVAETLQTWQSSLGQFPAEYQLAASNAMASWLIAHPGIAPPIYVSPTLSATAAPTLAILPSRTPTTLPSPNLDIPPSITPLPTVALPTNNVGATLPALTAIPPQKLPGVTPQAPTVILPAPTVILPAPTAAPTVNIPVATRVPTLARTVAPTLPHPTLPATPPLPTVIPTLVIPTLTPVVPLPTLTLGLP
jgi:hypothetical protein